MCSAQSRPWAGTHPDQRVVGNSCACDVARLWVLGLQQWQEAQNDKSHVQHHANMERHQSQEKLIRGWRVQ